MIAKWMFGKQGITVKTVAVALLFLGFLLPPTLLYFKLVSLRHLVSLLGGIPTLSMLVYIVLCSQLHGYKDGLESTLVDNWTSFKSTTHKFFET